MGLFNFLNIVIQRKVGKKKIHIQGRLRHVQTVGNLCIKDTFSVKCIVQIVGMA